MSDHFLSNGSNSRDILTVILKSQELQIDRALHLLHSLSHWNNYGPKYFVFCFSLCLIRETQIQREQPIKTLIGNAYMGCNIQWKVPALSLLYHLFIHYNFFSEFLARLVSSVSQGLDGGWAAALSKFWLPPEGYSVAFQIAWNNVSRFRFHLNLFTEERLEKLSVTKCLLSEQCKTRGVL